MVFYCHKTPPINIYYNYLPKHCFLCKTLLNYKKIRRVIYNYKSILIDSKKELIGFYAERNSGSYDTDYLLYTYKDGRFKKVFTNALIRLSFVSLFLNSTAIKHLQ